MSCSTQLWKYYKYRVNKKLVEHGYKDTEDNNYEALKEHSENTFSLKKDKKGKCFIVPEMTEENIMLCLYALDDYVPTFEPIDK